MDLNRDLNLVVPIVREGITLYAHSTPISQPVFEAYHAVLARAFSDITDGGLNIQAGLATAALALRDVAQQKGLWEGPAGVEKGLIGEMRRLTTVFAPGPDGWDTFLLDDAVKRSVIDDEERREVENAIVFFTLASHMFRRSQRPLMLAAISDVGGLRITSSNSTAYRDSLPTSTTDETSPDVAV